jgi:hypothetical protein
MFFNVFRKFAVVGGLVVLSSGLAMAGQQTSGAPCGGAYSATYGSGSSTYKGECGTNAAKNSVAVVSNEVLKVAASQTVGLISERISNVTQAMGRDLKVADQRSRTTLVQEALAKRLKDIELEKLRQAHLDREKKLSRAGFHNDGQAGDSSASSDVPFKVTVFDTTETASQASGASPASGRNAARTGTPIRLDSDRSDSHTIDLNGGVDERYRYRTLMSGNSVGLDEAKSVLAMSGAAVPLLPGIGPRGFELNFDENGGLAAGNQPAKWGVWMSGGYSHINYNRIGDHFNGRLWTVAAGLDYRFTPNLVGGLSGAWENVDLDTTFNRGTFEGDGWTVAPYIAYMFNQNFSLDLTGGYSNLSYDMKRIDPGDNTSISGKTDANRYFGAFNLNANTDYNNWRFGGRVGTLYANERKDSFTESNQNRVLDHNARLGRALVGGRVGYLFGNIFEPFFDATYRYDYSDGNAHDHDDILLKGGAKFYAGSMAVGMIEASTPVLRDDTNQWSVMGTIRLSF